MSFSVRCDRTGLEYAGTGLRGLFAQRMNVVRPRFWQLISDWLKFNRLARRTMCELDDHTTVDEFFARYPFSETFREQYFLPLGSAVWSCPRSTFGQFPVRQVLEFYQNHGMLNLPGSVPWKVVQGGSRRYVDALLRRLGSCIRLRSPVVQVRRRGGRVSLQVSGQPAETFDHVIMACHSDQALRALGASATPLERTVLSAFPYQRNSVVLHTDVSVLPRCRRAWASWNYHLPVEDESAATVTYDMTRLQRLPTAQRFLVTLNGDDLIDPRCVLGRFVYHHPVFTSGRAAAQRRHRELINYRGISYCGAYWGHGFHEDGVNSALAVVERLQAAPEAKPSEPLAIYEAAS
jgi:predicted NAD/FAD-binding protein